MKINCDNSSFIRIWNDKGGKKELLILIEKAKLVLTKYYGAETKTENYNGKRR